MKHWHIAISIVIGAISILSVLGFNSPAHGLAEVKKNVEMLTNKVAEHDVKLATIDTKLAYIAEGIDELRKRKK